MIYIKYKLRTWDPSPHWYRLTYNLSTSKQLAIMRGTPRIYAPWHVWQLEVKQWGQRWSRMARLPLWLAGISLRLWRWQLLVMHYVLGTFENPVVCIAQDSCTLLSKGWLLTYCRAWSLTSTWATPTFWPTTVSMCKRAIQMSLQPALVLSTSEGESRTQANTANTASTLNTLAGREALHYKKA